MQQKPVWRQARFWISAAIGIGGVTICLTVSPIYPYAAAFWAAVGFGGVAACTGLRRNAVVTLGALAIAAMLVSLVLTFFERDVLGSQLPWMVAMQALGLIFFGLRVFAAVRQPA